MPGDLLGRFPGPVDLGMVTALDQVWSTDTTYTLLCNVLPERVSIIDLTHRTILSWRLNRSRSRARLQAPW
jgi:transposase InsO family protein